MTAQAPDIPPAVGMTAEGARVSAGHKTNGQNVLGPAPGALHALLAQEASGGFALAAATPTAAQTKQASWVSPRVPPTCSSSLPISHQTPACGPAPMGAEGTMQDYGRKGRKGRSERGLGNLSRKHGSKAAVLNLKKFGPRGHLTMSKDVFGCHNWRGGGHTCI